ncbi:TnsA endonuclease N-terminal domain-containing protein [Microbulbifer sp. ZKSA004]|uniref:TnsA endonuclease N-terminal domain-containing protein n=1 Tax=unclassified Microbulbifer TaxID=2619833 RepID=UPI004039AD1F
MARHRRLERLTDFQRALKNKYGLGAGEEYKPWLRVQDVKSKGNSGKIQGIKVNREHHTLSENESCLFYLVENCDSVIDIREQFPLLPLDFSIKIAKNLDINHPKVPGSGSYNVMTTDFVLTCTDKHDFWYEAISVKSAQELSIKRTAEKLEIERIWWELLGVNFHIYTINEISVIQSKNIQWFTSAYRQGRRFKENIEKQAIETLHVGINLIEDICNGFCKNLDVENDEALVLLKHLIAIKKVEVDLSKPIVESGVIDITNILSSIGR